MNLFRAFKSICSELNPFKENHLAALIRACQQGDLKTVDELFTKKKLRINPMPIQSILTSMAMYNQVKILNYLLHSRNTKEFQQSIKSLDPILESASIHGNKETVFYLLTLSSSPVYSISLNKENIALDYLSQLLHFEVIDLLIKSPLFKEKIDLHTNDDILFVQAFNNKKDDLLDYLIFERQLEKTSEINNFLNNSNLHNQSNPYLNQVKHMFEVRDLNKDLENELKVNHSSNQRKIKV